MLNNKNNQVFLGVVETIFLKLLSCGVGIVPSLFNVFALFQLVIAPINNTKKQRISFCFWETAHLPLLKSTLILSSHLGQNVGLGEG